MLEIFLLGQFKLKFNDLTIDLPSRPAQSLLAYLALNPGLSLRREKLASMLWGESTEINARSYLRQALWRIRKAFEANLIRWEDFFEISEITITFIPASGYRLDAQVLLEISGGSPLVEIIEAVRLYRGELLPGFYDEWVVLERDRLQAAYSQKMDLLLERLIDTGQWDDVLSWGEEWIRNDISPEPAYRAMMIAHARSGRPGMVGATYQRCLEALKRDLELEPSPETTRLYEQIRRGELEEPAMPSKPVPKPGSPHPSFFDQRQPSQIEKPIFVARERELKKMGGQLDLALKSQGRVIFITGEAGTGKTSLLNEFTLRNQEIHPDLIVVNGNCNAQTGVGDPYLPFREILELLTGDVEARWLAGAFLEEYARFLWSLIPDSIQALIEVGPDLIESFIPGEAIYQRALEFGSTDPDWLKQVEGFLRKKTAPALGSFQQGDLFTQYTKVLQALAQLHPLVLVVDDLQWADLGSINLLFQLGRSLAGSRILVVGAYRPEEISLGRAGERHPLEPVIHEFQRLFGDLIVNVEQVDGLDFIDALLDAEPNELDRSFRNLLFQQTGGHPLFTVELLRGMEERGDLIPGLGGKWTAGSHLDWDSLPARVEAVIAERISRLDQPLQALLRTASVEGEVFTAEVVAQALGRDPAQMLELLSGELDRVHHLVRAQSIQRLEDQLISGYRFRHILVQKYLYNSLDEVERVHLHERVGSVLEELNAKREGTLTFSLQLARHFQEARIPDKASTYLLQAGERALNLSAYREAVEHLSKGLEYVASIIPDSKKKAELEISLQITIGKAWHGSFGNTPEIEQAYIRARELSQEIGNTSSLCLALSGLSLYYYVKAENRKALELAEIMFSLSLEHADPLLISIGHWNIGIVQFALGDYDGAREHYGHVLAAYDPKIHHQELVSSRGVDVGVSTMAYDACCLWILGYPDQAAKQSQKAIDYAREHNHAFTLGDVYCFAGCQFSTMIGDIQALETYSHEMENLFEDGEIDAWRREAYCYKGEAVCMRGQLDEGIILIEEGIASSLSRGEYLQFPRMLYLLAQAYSQKGDLSKAWEKINMAFETMEKSSERNWESTMYRIRASLHTSQGNFSQAETDLEKALEKARQQNARSWELQAAIDLSHLLQQQGRLDEARLLLSEVYSWFTEGFDTPDLKAARELLAAIG